MSLRRQLAEQAAAVKNDKSIMRSYQKDNLVPWMIDNPFSGVFVDMGLGKTVSVLTMLDHEFTHGRIAKALIVAPLRVAVQTWPTEMSEWSHTWWMSRTLIRPDEQHPELLAAMAEARAEACKDEFGSPNNAAGKARTAHLELQRRRLARQPTMVHVINREKVDWLVALYGALWPYDCVIVDESTSFADHRTVRWKALNSVRNRLKRLHLLSGIPAPEGIEDYFAQVYLLDRGDRFGRGITAFRERYLKQSQYTRKWTPRPGAGQEVASKIADICIVMREEDYLDRGKPTVIERPIILNPAEMKQYKDFASNLILETEDGEIEAENSSALWQKLMQYASGAVYGADGSVHEVHSHKLEELAQLREEAQGSPLLVAYWHKPSLARIRKLFPKAVVMDRRGDAVTAWNAGEIDMLLIHPQSAGHGLNMQLGPGHTLVFYDNPSPLELYLQTIKRLDRPGQKKPVKVYHLTTRGTIDQAIVPSLRGKEDAQDAVRKYIRDLRNNMETRA